MNKKPYSSAIKKTPFRYFESKTIAKLIYEKNDRNDIVRKCCEENFLGIESLARRKEITTVIFERLILLDNILIEMLITGDVETSKFILVYAIAKSDSLFMDFLSTVYREALLGIRDYISVDDFEYFFATIKENDEIVRKWGKFTVEQLGKGYRNILVESGLGVRDKRTIKIANLIIHPEVIANIKMAGDTAFLESVLGVV